MTGVGGVHVASIPAKPVVTENRVVVVATIQDVVSPATENDVISGVAVDRVFGTNRRV